jgi:hypothetical protein
MQSTTAIYFRPTCCYSTRLAGECNALLMHAGLAASMTATGPTTMYTPPKETWLPAAKGKGLEIKGTFTRRVWLSDALSTVCGAQHGRQFVRRYRHQMLSVQQHRGIV